MQFKKFITYSLRTAIVFLLLSFPVAAADTATITTSAQAIVEVQAQTATLRAQVSALAGNYEEAARDARARMERLRKTLRKVMDKEVVLTSSQLTARPEHTYQDGARTLVGYRVQQDLQVTGVPVPRLGHYIQAILSNDLGNLGPIQYASEEQEAAYLEALAAATRKARAKAQTIASASGFRTVEVLEVQEGAAGVTPHPRQSIERLAAASEPAPVTLNPGTIQVRADVQLKARGTR